MTNMNNFGFAEGRVARDLSVFENDGGSRKICMTLALQDNFTDRSGTRNAQFVQFETFISSESFARNGIGVYDLIKKGDLIKVEYTLRSSSYTDRNREKVFRLSPVIQSVQFGEPKSVADERRARKELEAAPA